MRKITRRDLAPVRQNIPFSSEYSICAEKFLSENGQKYGRTDGKESTIKGQPVGRPSIGQSQWLA